MEANLQTDPDDCEAHLLELARTTERVADAVGNSTIADRLRAGVNGCLSGFAFIRGMNREPEALARSANAMRRPEDSHR